MIVILIAYLLFYDFMQKIMAIFESTHNVIKAERICLKEGVRCQAIPVPREISSNCGIALEISDADKDRIQQILTSHFIITQFKLISNNHALEQL
jgi:hypothetical protein